MNCELTFQRKNVNNFFYANEIKYLYFDDRTHRLTIAGDKFYLVIAPHAMIILISQYLEGEVGGNSEGRKLLDLMRILYFREIRKLLID